MTATDIEPAVSAILADDWGDRRAWFEFAVASPACRVFVADDGEGGIAGTGVATINGSVAWIGTIWVASDFRRRGLGRALTQAPIDAAEAAGCRTLVLVATDRGRPMYERIGFEVQTWYRTMEAPGKGPADGQPDRHIRAFRGHDLAAMGSLDAAATGEDRSHLLASLATPSGTRVLVGVDDDPRAFLIRAPWGGGATIAPRVDDALAILQARRLTYGPDRLVRCGILVENEAGTAALEADGWTEAWRAPVSSAARLPIGIRSTSGASSTMPSAEALLFPDRIPHGLPRWTRISPSSPVASTTARERPQWTGSTCC